MHLTTRLYGIISTSYILSAHTAIGTDRPEIKDLYKHVTPCFAAYWEDIGVYLDIELRHLETIKANYPNNASVCCKDV